MSRIKHYVTIVLPTSNLKARPITPGASEMGAHLLFSRRWLMLDEAILEAICRFVTAG